MRKRIRFYHQRSVKKCGAACVLMFLDYYRKTTYPTQKQEDKLDGIYHSKVLGYGMTGAAAAKCLSWNRLKVRVLHSSEQLMDNRDGYFPEEQYQALLKEYRKTLSECSSLVTVEAGVSITNEMLKKELAAGKQMMVESIVPGNADGVHDHVLHWIVVYDYENGEFLVCNPLKRKIRLTEQELSDYMDTPIGRLCIVVDGEA